MDFLKRKAFRSIRYWLLMLLIPGVVILLLIDSGNDYRNLTDITRHVYDSALLEPAKVLETSVEFNADGSLRLDPPFYAQVMLESRAGNRKYFHVEEIISPVDSLAGSSAQRLEGRTLMGMQGLPRPDYLPRSEGVPIFYDAVFRHDAVRMVALWRDLHYDGMRRQVIVLVGESMDMRLRTRQEAWHRGLLRDGSMLVLMVLLVWFSVQWALRPLNLLRQEVKARKVDDLSPLDINHVPREVIPLVRAVNHHIELYRQVLDRQEQFLADASHQLRTPLAIMRTQAQYARREPDIHRTRETLDAIIRQVEQTTRLTEQLLSLAHASQYDSTPHGKIDLNGLARDVALQYLPLAREKQQDLGWVDSFEDGTAQSGGPIWVCGNEAELHEALANLVHNAINHAGPGCTITVAASIGQDGACASVCDNGPGLDPTLRESVFMRFDRGSPDRKKSRGTGSGLGLAISLAYARRNGGTVVLRDGEPNSQGGKGLRAILQMPLFHF